MDYAVGIFDGKKEKQSRTDDDGRQIDFFKIDERFREASEKIFLRGGGETDARDEKENRNANVPAEGDLLKPIVFFDETVKRRAFGNAVQKAERMVENHHQNRKSFENLRIVARKKRNVRFFPEAVFLF